MLLVVPVADKQTHILGIVINNPTKKRVLSDRQLISVIVRPRPRPRVQYDGIWRGFVANIIGMCTVLYGITMSICNLILYSCGSRHYANLIIEKVGASANMDLKQLGLYCHLLQ